ncbi:HlyD family type I secretion periplasmic adaptor subunit [Solidesulfovibrio magneticus]|uniref:Type I secretion system n=1 Tax=Solidesulfovibrio magneticus (strain ATCC 700980 / DSM 13731 / RS-1) TaxID=573370 RepID=C4XMC6_SOLM1|nr:HlyD family type I secretion periplasmic adaptor subunit [Solidesulfovibrio magneticus]BAH77251.1 putative type I secretion system [Solidesulfovibrio magneticus RS-1]
MGRRNIRPEAMEFQPDAVAVSEGEPPVQARIAVYVIFACLVFGGLWAWFSELDRVVSAGGMLVTRVPPIVVQPLETAVVRQINVRPGDVVRRGAVLATLDPTFASADFGQLAAKRRFLSAFVVLLAAELDGRPLPALDESAMDGEEKVRLTLFAMRKEEFRAKVEANDREVALLEDAVAANAAERMRLGEQANLAKEIEGMFGKLVPGGGASRLEYLGALREKLRVDDLAAKTEEKREQLVEQLSRAKMERQAFVSNWRAQTATQLLEARQNLDEVDHSLAKASRRSELVELSAVADAIVKEVAPLSEGSIAKAAETFCVLVPIGDADGALEAEVSIAAADIGHIRVGNETRLKLAAYPFQRHGFLDGVVRMVSPDAFVAEGAAPGHEGGQDGVGGVHYKARIRLTRTTLRDVGPDFRLLPGMTVSAEILVGKRRVATYILDPVIRGLHEALNEP